MGDIDVGPSHIVIVLMGSLPSVIFSGPEYASKHNIFYSLAVAHSEVVCGRGRLEGGSVTNGASCDYDCVWMILYLEGSKSGEADKRAISCLSRHGAEMGNVEDVKGLS